MKVLINGIFLCICLVVLVSETESKTTKAVTTPAAKVTQPPQGPKVTQPQGPAGTKPPGGGASGMVTGSMYKWTGILLFTLFILKHF